MRWTDKEFIESWQKYQSSSEMAANLSRNERSILKRRRAMEVKYGISLEAKKSILTISTKPSAARKDLGILNGTVIVFSDAHFWPSVHTTAFRGLLWAIKEFKPTAVIANGDGGGRYRCTGRRIQRDRPGRFSNTSRCHCEHF